MGVITNFEPEKLVMGIMFVDAEQYMKVQALLQSVYGEIDSTSEVYSFSEYSRYYDREMNGEVFKRFVSFKKLVDPSSLSSIKLLTNRIEADFSTNGYRHVNIDPCLIGHGKFVMATTKNASFRLPHINGIYYDLSLVYARNQWTDFYWTYFDIKSQMIKNYLAKVRRLYLKQRKGLSL